MDPISNADRLMGLLRQTLRERAKSSPLKSRSKPTSKNAQGLDTVHALAKAESLDQGQLQRALIEGLLADQLGQSLSNDARFQSIVDRVTRAVVEDSAGRALVDATLSELRRR